MLGIGWMQMQRSESTTSKSTVTSKSTRNLPSILRRASDSSNYLSGVSSGRDHGHFGGGLSRRFSNFSAATSRMSSELSFFDRKRPFLLTRLTASTPEERAVLGAVIFMCIWLVCASSFLLINSLYYHSSVVDEARLRFLWVSAERAAKESEKVLEVALLVRNAMHYAVSRQLYYDPMDYQAALSALQPVFISTPELRSVELAFTDRAESISLVRQRRNPPTASPELILQTDNKDCATLGPWGCSPHVPARQRAWYDACLQLRNWDDRQDNSTDFTSSVDGAGGFMWLDTPGFIPHINVVKVNSTSREEEVTEQGAVRWVIASSLVFRVVFPGTSRHVSVLGHAVIEVDGLRKSMPLRDQELLGSKGGIFVCDRTGTLVAVHELGKQVQVEADSGNIRFRQLSDLSDSEAWASEVHERLSAAVAAPKREHAQAEGFDIVSTPLLNPNLSHFSVVVAAQRDPFVDGTLEGMTQVGLIIVWVPIPFVTLVFAIWCIHRKMAQRKKLKRIRVVEEAMQTLRKAEKQGMAPDPRSIRFTRIFEDTPETPRPLPMRISHRFW